MENVRVNKITVNVNKKDDETIISLYKTNQLLAYINSDDLDIDSFSHAGVSMKAYQLYCKDIIINLLDNGGIDGYYYEPKEEAKSVKYGMSDMRTKCKEYIDGIIGDKYSFSMTCNDKKGKIEQYADGYIKNASVTFGVKMLEYDVEFGLLMEIKSGQACRPRVYEYGGSQFSFNITNINKLIKDL